MDPRQREKLLAKIPTSDLRIEAFKQLGDDESVALMLGYQSQLEEIRAESKIQVPTKRIFGRAILIGSLAGAGVVGTIALISADNVAVSLNVEAVKQGIIAVGAGALAGGLFSVGFGGLFVERAENKFIHNREKPVRQHHRELLKAQLSDDQVAALFLQIAAEK